MRAGKGGAGVGEGGNHHAQVTTKHGGESTFISESGSTFKQGSRHESKHGGPFGASLNLSI